MCAIRNRKRLHVSWQFSQNFIINCLKWVVKSSEIVNKTFLLFPENNANNRITNPQNNFEKKWSLEVMQSNLPLKTCLIRSKFSGSCPVYCWTPQRTELSYSLWGSCFTMCSPSLVKTNQRTNQKIFWLTGIKAGSQLHQDYYAITVIQQCTHFV